MDCHWTLKIFWDMLTHMLSCSFMLHNLCLFHMLGWTLAFLIQNLFGNWIFELNVQPFIAHIPPNRSSIITILSLPFTIGMSFIIFQHHSLSLGSAFELIDCLSMEPALGYAFAVAPCIQSWCSTVAVIHQVQPNIDVPKEPIYFFYFLIPSNVWN